MLFKRGVNVLKMEDHQGNSDESEEFADVGEVSSPTEQLRISNITLQLPVTDNDLRKVLLDHYRKFRDMTYKIKEFEQFNEMFSFIAKMMFNETAHFNFPIHAENNADEFFEELVESVRSCLQQVDISPGIKLPELLPAEDVPLFIFIFSLFIDADTYLKTEIGLHDKQTSNEWKNGFAKYLIKGTFKKCVIRDHDKKVIEKFLNHYRTNEMENSDLKQFIVCLQLLKCLRKNTSFTNSGIFGEAETEASYDCKDMIKYLFQKVKEEYLSNNFDNLQHEIMDHCARFLNMFPMLMSSGLKVGNMTISSESEYYGIVDTDQILTCDIVVSVNRSNKPEVSSEETESSDAVTCSYVVLYAQDIVDGNESRQRMIEYIKDHIYCDIADVTTMHDHLYFLRPNVHFYPVNTFKSGSEGRTITSDTHLSNPTQYGFYPSYLKDWYDDDNMREVLVTVVHTRYPSKVYGISINDKIISNLAMKTLGNGGEVEGSTNSGEEYIV